MGIYCGLSKMLQTKSLGFNSKYGFLKLLCDFTLVKTGDLDWQLRIFHPVPSVHNWSEFINVLFRTYLSISTKCTLHRRSLAHSDYFTYVPLIVEDIHINSVPLKKKKFKPHFISLSSLSLTKYMQNQDTLNKITYFNILA